MSIHNPQPWFTSFLVLGLPAIWLGGLELSRRAVRDATLACVLAPGVGLAVWLLSVHVIGLISLWFTLGLWVGTLLAAGGGLAWVIARARRGEPWFVAREAMPSRWMWIGSAATTLLAAPAALGWSFHDEVFITGHMSIASQLLNGIYPPRHMVFANSPLRYHYGFDLLSAITAALFRLRIDRAIDAVTLAGWFYSTCVAWALGERHLGRARGLLGSAFFLLTGGLALCIGSADAPFLVSRLLGISIVQGAVLNPPIASYLFQHPWSLGFPIGLCALALFLERPERTGRLVHGGLLLAILLVLALSQVTLFLAFLAAMLATELVLAPRFRPAATAIGFVAVAFGLAKLLGGFFATSPGQAGLAIRVHPFSQTGNLSGNLLWTIGSLGLELPLGLAGLYPMWRRNRRAGLFFGLVVAGSLCLVNLFAYAYSWDIVKFASVASLALALPAASAVMALTRMRPKILGRAAAGLAVLLVTLAGVGFLAPFALHLDGIPRFFFTAPTALTGEDAQVIDWLRRRVAPGDVVWRTAWAHSVYAQWGGLPQAFPDKQTPAWGFPPDWLQRRVALLRNPPADPGRYRAQGIRWLVLQRQDDAALDAIAQSWMHLGHARFAFEAGDLRVYEILP